MNSTPISAPISVAWGAATDVGLRRALNEDSFLAAPPLFLVADGMGGHQAGEVASATVIDEFSRLVGRASLTVDDVQASVRQARRRVDALSEGADAAAGTTLAGVGVAEVDGEAHWLAVNLGDSRTYRLIDGVLQQISVDHSVVQELIDAGQLDAATAARDSRRNVITRALGAGSDSEPDYWLFPATEGDRLLICSDGLPTELPDDRIADILRAEPHPQSAADGLVREAVGAGGRDNVTVVVVDALAVTSRNRHDRPAEMLPPTLFEEDGFEDTLPRARVRG